MRDFDTVPLLRGGRRTRWPLDRGFTVLIFINISVYLHCAVNSICRGCGSILPLVQFGKFPWFWGYGINY